MAGVSRDVPGLAARTEDKLLYVIGLNNSGSLLFRDKPAHIGSG